MSIADDPRSLERVVRLLVEVLSKETGKRRVASVWAMDDDELKSLFTTDLRSIAYSATFLLCRSEESNHPLSQWQVTYVADGMMFVATPPAQ